MRRPASEIEVTTRHRGRANRQPALVDRVHGGRIENEHRIVDEPAESVEIRVPAGSERAPARPTGLIDRRCVDLEAVLGQRVGDGEVKDPGPPRLRVQPVLQTDRAGALLCDGPRRPAHQAVDRVVLAWLGQRRLEPVTVPLEASVTQAVRPRYERLASPTRTHLLTEIAVQHGPVAHGIGPETRTQFRPRSLPGRREQARIVVPTELP